MVEFSNLYEIHKDLKQEFHDILEATLNDSCFVGGNGEFASKWRQYTGSDYCVTCNSGTDALYIALRAFDFEPHARVAVPAVSYAATAMAVVNAGLEPVFVDVDPVTGLMDWDEFHKREEGIVCVVPVHLFGQYCKVPESVRDKYVVIEDCAQAHGLRVDEQHVGVRADVACFSFYPGKNLGALGDAGAVITSSATLYEKMRAMARLGSSKTDRYMHETVGINSRMDILQDRFLVAKLKYLDQWTEERRRVARLYGQSRDDVVHVLYILVPPNERDELIRYAKSEGIQLNCHYPHALCDLPCFEKWRLPCPNATKFCASCVSLPLYPYMTQEDVDKVKKVLDHPELKTVDNKLFFAELKNSFEMKRVFVVKNFDNERRGFHKNKITNEWIFVLSGTLTIEIDGNVNVVPTHGCIFIPKQSWIEYHGTPGTSIFVICDTHYNEEDVQRVR
jgi:dTDP-4-amino-4,6-dideoxygalactose transaminase